MIVRLSIIAVPAFFALTLAGSNEASATTCAARSDEIMYAIDCDSGTSTTDGIQEAVDTCGNTSNFDGRCVVRLPAGVVDLEEPIHVGTFTTGGIRAGITLVGHGAGHIGNSPSTATFCGTTLEFTGSSGDAYAAIHMQGARSVVLSDFCIDGNTVLENGIVIEGDIATSAPAMGNTIERVSLVDIDGAAILLSGYGADKNDQVDSTSINQVRVARGRTSGGVYTSPDYCVKQTGGSRLTWNVIDGLNCSVANEDGVLNEGGGMTIRNSFIGDAKATTGAGIRMTGDFNLAVIEDTAFETDTGHGIVTEYGTSGGAPIMKIVNNRIDLGESGTNALDYNHKGTLTLIGNRVGSRSGASSLGWRITPAAPTLNVTEGANHLGSALIERSDDNILTSIGAGISATVCTSQTKVGRGRFCWDKDDFKLYVCGASDGECDTSSEWKLIN